MASASHARASRPSSLSITAQASSFELVGETMAAARSRRSAGRMGGCPGLASWLPCLRVAAELAAPASLQAWLALFLALAALCLLLGTKDGPTMSSAVYLSSRALAWLVIQKRSFVGLIICVLWDDFRGALLAACKTL